MNLLVTGGAGYIGSHMARMLATQNHTVVVLDTLEYGHALSLPSAIHCIQGNVSDSEKLTEIFTNYKIDAVIHFAGYTSVSESVTDPKKYFHNNVQNPLSLLLSMREFNIRYLIFSSTAAVYGEPSTIPIPENHEKHPLSPYGLSKWVFEQLLESFGRTSNLRSISLRYFNAAGASLDGMYGEDHTPETHLIPLAIRTSMGKQKEFLLYGTDYKTVDGTAVRDYIHVEDLCAAHVLALDALANNHATDVFNIGTSKGYTVNQVIDEIKGRTGEFPVKHVLRRPGDVAELVADSSRIKKEFNWEPTHSDLATIVSSALLWHTSHPEGYQK